jgi:hypothetical protein
LQQNVSCENFFEEKELFFFVWENFVLQATHCHGGQEQLFFFIGWSLELEKNNSHLQNAWETLEGNVETAVLQIGEQVQCHAPHSIPFQAWLAQFEHALLLQIFCQTFFKIELQLSMH